MLLQNPVAIERRCPRTWSLPTAGGLLSLAVLVAGVGLRAEAGPTPGNPAVATSSDDPQKDEPKTITLKIKKIESDTVTVFECDPKVFPCTKDVKGVHKPGTRPKDVQAMSTVKVTFTPTKDDHTIEVTVIEKK